MDKLFYFDFSLLFVYTKINNIALQISYFGANFLKHIKIFTGISFIWKNVIIILHF